jgi:uncharacterized protein YegP (UPF0339 family)
VKFEIVLEGGRYRWRLRASDGQRMADSSESYSRPEDVQCAIVALQASIPVATIVGGITAEGSTP